jgi:hypothetical protein
MGAKQQAVANTPPSSSCVLAPVAVVATPVASLDHHIEVLTATTAGISNGCYVAVVPSI